MELFWKGGALWNFRVELSHLGPFHRGRLGKALVFLALILRRKVLKTWFQKRWSLLLVCLAHSIDTSFQNGCTLLASSSAHSNYRSTPGQHHISLERSNIQTSPVIRIIFTIVVIGKGCHNHCRSCLMLIIPINGRFVLLQPI